MTAEPGTGSPSSSHTLVLYDGVCGLCNRLVSFLLRRDKQDEFRFAPLQSDLGQRLLRRHGLDPADLDSVVVLTDFRQPGERVLTRSSAVVAATLRLAGFWKICIVATIVPLTLREALYKFVARRRYEVFGKYDQCPLPAPADRDKFISSPD